MGIKYLTGNIFESKCVNLICPVTACGHATEGLQLEFLNHYKDLMQPYIVSSSIHRMNGCKGDWGLCAGGVVNCEHYVDEKHEQVDKRIFCLATRESYGDKASLSNITSGLDLIEAHVRCNKWGSIAMPAIGLDEGISWDLVEPIVEKYFGNWPRLVEVYLPLELAQKKVDDRNRKNKANSQTE